MQLSPRFLILLLTLALDAFQCAVNARATAYNHGLSLGSGLIPTQRRARLARRATVAGIKLQDFSASGNVPLKDNMGQLLRRGIGRQILKRSGHGASSSSYAGPSHAPPVANTLLGELGNHLQSVHHSAVSPNSAEGHSLATTYYNWWHSRYMQRNGHAPTASDSEEARSLIRSHISSHYISQGTSSSHSSSHSQHAPSTHSQHSGQSHYSQHSPYSPSVYSQHSSYPPHPGSTNHSPSHSISSGSHYPASNYSGSIASSGSHPLPPGNPGLGAADYMALLSSPGSSPSSSVLGTHGSATSTSYHSSSNYGSSSSHNSYSSQHGANVHDAHPPAHLVGLPSSNYLQLNTANYHYQISDLHPSYIYDGSGESNRQSSSSTGSFLSRGSSGSHNQHGSHH